QLREGASGPDAHHGAASVELAEDGFDRFGRVGGAKRHIDGGEYSAGERKQMGGKNEAIFGQAGVLENFRGMAMRKKIVSLEIFVDFDEVKVTTGIFAGAADTRLAITDYAAVSDQTGFGEGAHGENDTGGVATGIGDQARGGDFLGVQLGKAVDGLAEPVCVGRGELIPGGESVGGA